MTTLHLHHRRLPRPPATPDSHDFGTRPYDLVKEFVIALVVVSLLTVAPRCRVLLPRRKGRDAQGVGDDRTE